MRSLGMLALHALFSIFIKCFSQFFFTGRRDDASIIDGQVIDFIDAIFGERISLEFCESWVRGIVAIP